MILEFHSNRYKISSNKKRKQLMICADYINVEAFFHQFFNQLVSDIV